ncbi:MAG: hypothetical protein V2A74_12990 [bacterium]
MRFVRRLILFSFAIFLIGCRAQFMSQDVVLARSTFGGDLYLLVVYHGIYAEEGYYNDAVKELDAFVTSGDQFAIFGWPFSSSLGEIRKGLTEENRKKHPAAFRFESYFCDHTDIGLGCLYQDSETSGLGGYQVVRFRGISKHLRLGNAAIREALLEDESSTSTQPYPRTIERWKSEARKGKFNWFEMDGTAPTVNLPVDPDEFVKMRDEFLNDLVTSIWDHEDTTETLKQEVAMLSQNPISLIQKTDCIKVVVGDPSQKQNRLRLPRQPEEEKEKSANLMEWASRQGLWEGARDPKDIIADFQKNPAKFFKRLHFVEKRG